MKKRLLSSLLHIGVFVLIEIAFVFIILHEFPEIGFFEELGVIHLAYWIMIFIAGYVRENLHSYKTKFVATYMPVVFHILGHVYLSHVTVELVEEHAHHAHGSPFWLIVSTLILGIFIFAGEYLLHKRYHCESHHAKAHKHCKED